MTFIGNPSNPKGNRFEYKGRPQKCRGDTLESMCGDVVQACFVTTRCVNAAAGLSSNGAFVLFIKGVVPPRPGRLVTARLSWLVAAR